MHTRVERRRAFVFAAGCGFGLDQRLKNLSRHLLLGLGSLLLGVLFGLLFGVLFGLLPLLLGQFLQRAKRGKSSGGRGGRGGGCSSSRGCLGTEPRMPLSISFLGGLDRLGLRLILAFPAMVGIRDSGVVILKRCRFFCGGVILRRCLQLLGQQCGL